MPRPAHSILIVCAATLVALLPAGCTPTPAPGPSSGSTAPAASPTPSTSAFVDGGPRRFATGSTTAVHGAFRYIVAAGDTAGAIAARFGTSPDRVADASRGGLEVFEGDVLRITRD